jgi:hypothetical protein
MTATDTEGPEKEARVLHAMKRTLTNIIKDTTTQPGLQHPLSSGTIEDIRQCLSLISAREKELAQLLGKDANFRPHYADEPSQGVVVPIGRSAKSKKPDNDGE